MQQNANMNYNPKIITSIDSFGLKHEKDCNHWFIESVVRQVLQQLNENRE